MVSVNTAPINWDELSRLGSLRAVIDPNDVMGYKNMLIDRVHWLALKEHFYGTKNLLDFGCGTGRFAKRIQARGVRYTGIDSSQGMVDAAKKGNHGEENSFKYFDGLNIPFADASFDTVVSSRVFIHLLKSPEGNVVLSEIKRVLVPGGRFILLEEASLSQRKSGQARWVLTEEDFTSVLSQNFEVKEVHKVRSSEFSKFSRRITEIPGCPDFWFRMMLKPLARFEYLRVRCLTNQYFAKVTYYDFLIDTVLRNK